MTKNGLRASNFSVFGDRAARQSIPALAFILFRAAIVGGAIGS